MNALFPISTPHSIEVPFIKASFGGVDFGLTDRRNPKTGVMASDFITSLEVKKYGSGAVNTYTLNMTYVITPGVDPNYVDLVISRATDREIYFTYGDKSQPQYSYKNEKGIITNIVPHVDYKNNKIDYTITATSSTTLTYSTKASFSERYAKPSDVILEVLYSTKYGLTSLLTGMIDKDLVLAKGWIPRTDKSVSIKEKKDIAPMDYILYLVSLMEGDSGEFFFLKVIDAMNENLTPHFEIVSTSSKQRSEMMTITVGYPGSIPVYDLSITQDSSIALLVDYRNQIENGIYQDYSFAGDLVSGSFYKSQTVDGNPSENLKKWWDKMISFPISASLTTQGLYIPAEIVKSVYLDVYFFGKRYNHSGEYLIMEQSDSISARGFRTTLSLLRIGGDDVSGENN